jgi:hypothetical protein
MKYFNAASRDDVTMRLIDYTAFVNGLRLPLTGRRLGAVEQVWGRIAGDVSAESTTVVKAKEAFKYEQFETVCSAMDLASEDETVIPRESFFVL